MLNTYEAKQVDMTWDGLDLTKGTADDTFLTIEAIGAAITTTSGNDGQMSASKMSDQRATITLTLKQTSNTNKQLAKRMSLQMAIGAPIPVGVFQVTDKVGDSAHFLALNAVLTEKPGHEFGAAMGEKSWVWVCENYLETDNIADVTSALADFIKTS